MSNLLLEKIEYQIEKTPRGVWRRYMYSSGASFGEYKSTQTLFGLPLIHYTYGKCPETGRRIVAKGIFAMGKVAIGVIAIGHASIGIIAIGQLAISLLLGLGQATTGMIAIGQLALGIALGLGQFSTGAIAIGQFAFGKYVWSPKRADTIAIEFFRSLWSK